MNCRMCNEPLVPKKNDGSYKPCRNGCSQVTARLPDGAQSVFTEGLLNNDRSVYGCAYRTRETTLE